VNAHEGKAGMVLSMPERFECTTLAKKRYINTLPFLSFMYNGNYETDDLTRKPGILLFPVDSRRQAVKRDIVLPEAG